jgi:hypothetical protein
MMIGHGKSPSNGKNIIARAPPNVNAIRRKWDSLQGLSIREEQLPGHENWIRPFAFAPGRHRMKVLEESRRISSRLSSEIVG